MSSSNAKSPPAHVQLALPDEAASTALGAALAHAIAEESGHVEAHGLTIALAGDLGAGKTFLVRALLRACGITGAVKSPTFTLLEPYEVSRLHFYHFDFYRFKTPKEFIDGGFDEYFGPAGVCLVEWPERAGTYLPAVDLRIALRIPESEHGARAVAIDALTEIGERCLDHLETLQTAANRESRVGA
jgi:tRNA threonylcarbamoyladenosine biosynthesis protein TsaE